MLTPGVRAAVRVGTPLALIAIIATVWLSQDANREMVGAKYAMSRLGLCSDEVRLPLTSLSDDTKALVDAGLKHAGLM